MAVHAFQVATKVLSGAGAVAEIGPLLASQGHKSVLVVTDQGIVSAGLLAPVTESLQAAGVSASVFQDVQADPEESIVGAVVAAYQDAGSDGLLAVGGGSSLDVAKAAGVVISNGGAVADYEGFDAFENDLPPLYAVPTTVGTGSEVTFAAVITLPKPAIQDVHLEHQAGAAGCLSRSRDADHVAAARRGAFGHGCADTRRGGNDVAAFHTLYQCLQSSCNSSHQ